MRRRILAGLLCSLSHYVGTLDTFIVPSILDDFFTGQFMAEDIVRLQNPEKYYVALEKLRSGKTKVLIPENRALILQFLRDAELGRTILKGQKKKIMPGRLQRMLGLLLKMDQQWFKKKFDEVYS